LPRLVPKPTLFPVFQSGWESPVKDYVKLFRCIERSEFYFAERFTKSSAWVDLLLMARWKKGTAVIRGIVVNLERGELAQSIQSLSKRWKWNERTTKRFLKLLQTRQMIHTRITNLTTVISILNYDKYQKDTDQSTYQSTYQNTDQNFGNTSKIKPSSTPKKDNKEKKDNINTNTGEIFPTEEQKSVEQEKTIKQIELPEFIEKEIWDDFVDMRKNIKKPITERGKKAAINKLIRFHEKGENVNEIIEESIIYNWQGLFSLKGKGIVDRDNVRKERTMSVLQEVLREGKNE
jgi:hypothetical protein